MSTILEQNRLSPPRSFATMGKMAAQGMQGAAATAMYVAQGARVCVVSCTGGERGDVLNETLKHDPHIQRDIAQVRRDEMAAAAAALGVEHVWLGFVDSGLPEGDPLPPLPEGCFALVPLEEASAPLVEIVRDFRPHVMTTYDPSGGYPHPDHIRCHEISKLAWDVSGDAEAYPEARKPWAIGKLYYESIFNPERMVRVYETLRERDPESPLIAQFEAMMDRFFDRPSDVTTRVEVGRFFDRRDEALRAHASQVAPDSSFFFWPNELQREAWPSEDYRLAASRVATSEFETDLFQGITEEQA